LKLRTTAAPLGTSASIAPGVTEMPNPEVKTTNLERSVARLYKRPVLETKHSEAIQSIANSRIPRTLAHRQLNRLIARIGDGAMHVVGSFADCKPVAALLSDDHIAMRVQIWQKDHRDEEILIDVPIVSRGEERFSAQSQMPVR